MRTAVKCTILWNKGFKIVHRGSRFLFFVFVNCYRRCVLSIRVTNEGSVVTHFLHTRRCYLTSETRFLNTHCCYLTSEMCFLNMRRCYHTSEMHFLNTRPCSLHISDAFLRVTNLFTSQTQRKWLCVFRVTNDPLDASLISISGIVIDWSSKSVAMHYSTTYISSRALGTNMLWLVSRW